MEFDGLIFDNGLNLTESETKSNWARKCARVAGMIKGQDFKCKHGS